MAFVLDASIAAAWVVPSQGTDYARRVRLKAKREPFHVPAIFAAEVANVLVTLERRAILSAPKQQRSRFKPTPAQSPPTSECARLRPNAL
jgi:predicted nucleic acid-binding protein